MAQAKEKDFVVNITKLTKAINQKGFGLIMIYDTEKAHEYNIYSDISAVSEECPVFSKAYKIASRIFAQNPRPQNVAIIGTTDTVEKPGTPGEFELTINKGFDENEIIEIDGNKYKYVKENSDAAKNEFDGDSPSTRALSLSSLLERDMKDFFFTVNENVITLTQKISGVGKMPLVVSSRANIRETTPAVLPTGLIAHLNNVREAHTEPFFLVCTDNSDETIKKLSNWIDTQDMMYFTTTQNLSAPKLVRSEQTVIMYHNDKDAYVAEGLASYLATANVGAVTSKFKTINGSPEAKITTGDLQELHKNNGFTYINKMGVLQTTDGKTTSGEWIDVVMGAFWIKFKMEENLAYLAVNTPKIGYDNKGIGLLVGVCDSVLKQAAFSQDIVLINSDGKAQYEIRYKTREETDKNDIANRVYNGITWSAKLAGAIHKAVINGTLEY